MSKYIEELKKSNKTLNIQNEELRKENKKYKELYYKQLKENVILKKNKNKSNNNSISECDLFLNSLRILQQL